MGNRIKRFLKLLYWKVFRINDTPQKIALGLGLGVFAGIIPGSGPIAALFLALIFRANRASALIGSLATNTWLSIVTFLLSIKVGSYIMGIDWHDAYNNWHNFLQNFKWAALFKLSIVKMVLPVAAGYFAVAFCLGLLVYIITWITISILKSD